MIAVLCEYSGRVRDAFIAKGFNAVSCDLLPTESPGPHFQGDAIEFLESYNWDMVIAFPPCTYLCSSGLHWNKRREGRAQKTENALLFVEKILSNNAKYICLENPVGAISTRIRKPDQIIQPYQFGHNASKKTCLWLKGLPILEETKYIRPRIVNGRKRWANQTDSGQCRLWSNKNRAKIRSLTFQGVADAMADQWSKFL
tara:strand:+ start:108 stop:707 length:600 start_codon:yes stop_codon:yes gene_type:complete